MDLLVALTRDYWLKLVQLKVHELGGHLVLVRLLLATEYKMTELEPANRYLGVEIIMYAATHTRPDLACASSLLSRFVSKLPKAHEQALQHVLRCICDDTNYGISYSGTLHNLYGHIDSDHSGRIPKKKGNRHPGTCFGWQIEHSHYI
jgi:hypothetical protein